MEKVPRNIGFVGARHVVPLLLLLFLLRTLPAHAQPDTLRVLFVGNSYTYTNDLPQLFANLSASGGQPVVVDMSAPGGWWLENHCSTPATLSKISLGIWDYVVLQEQSQVPTIDYYRYNSMYPSARSLDSLIVSYGQQTAFFMTWGREHGGQQTINQYSSPVFRDFFHMQDSLTSAYTQIANELNAELSPVGLGWAQAVTLDSTIDLWQEDGSHPTLQGSYLAACVFFATLIGRTPAGLPYTAGLSRQDALFLQYAAYRAVFETGELKSYPVVDRIVQISPNPFNPTTALSYKLQAASRVSLKVYDLAGRLVTKLTDGWREAGAHEVTFDGSGLASGVYVYQIKAGEYTASGKMVLLK